MIISITDIRKQKENSDKKSVYRQDVINLLIDKLEELEERLEKLELARINKI